MASLLRLGTRGSKLALVQTGLVRAALARAVPELAAPDAVEVVAIRTQLAWSPEVARKIS